MASLAVASTDFTGEDLNLSLAKHAPRVQAWNDNWQIADYLFGVTVAGYSSITSNAYAPSCFNSMMSLSSRLVTLSKQFDSGIPDVNWWDEYLWYARRALDVVSVLKTGVDCQKNYSEAMQTMWYEMYPFGAPEGQTPEELHARIDEIKRMLIEEIYVDENK